MGNALQTAFKEREGRGQAIGARAVLDRAEAQLNSQAPSRLMPSDGRSVWLGRVSGPMIALGVAASVLLLALGAASLGRFVFTSAEAPSTEPTEQVSTTTPTEQVSTTTTVPVAVPPPETTWERIVDGVFAPGLIWAVASTDDVIVAVGDAPDPTDVSSILGEFRNAVVWVSSDGRAWERIDDESVFGGKGYQILWGVVTGPLGIVASGTDGPNAALWFSPDGYDWEKVLVDDLGTPGVDDDFTVVAGGPGWVAIGGDGDSGGVVFVSEDGFEWTRVEDSARAEALVAFVDSSTVPEPVSEPPMAGVDWKYAWDGERVVGIGRHTLVAIWISTDSGVSWHRVDPEQSVFDGYPWPQSLDVTLFGTQIIVGGNAADDAAVWIGTWEEER